MQSESLFSVLMQIASLCLIACCILWISSLFASATYSLHHKYLSATKYRINIKWMFFYAASAICASIVVTIWLSLPHLTRLPLVFKHCHSSNCASHIPAIIDSTLLNLVFMVFSISLIAICVLLIKTHQKKLEERISSLLRLSQSNYSVSNNASQVTIIDAPQALILNVGILSPKLLLSSQLVDSISGNDVKLLVAYEYAKAKQFEHLKVKLIQIACLFWPKGIVRLLTQNVRAVLHKRAYKEIHHLLGRQQNSIPKVSLDNLPNNIQIFICRINTQGGTLSPLNSSMPEDSNLAARAYLAWFSYFVFLVIVTSNLTHFLFELVG